MSLVTYMFRKFKAEASPLYAIDTSKEKLYHWNFIGWFSFKVK